MRGTAHGLGVSEGEDPTAEVVHIDASLIRANVSWESLAERHAEDVLSENQTYASVTTQGMTS